MMYDSTHEKFDRTYLLKAMRRQSSVFLKTVFAGAILSLFLALNVSNLYRSSISVILDPRAPEGDVYTGRAWILAEQRNFRLKFSAQEFVDRIVTEAKISMPLRPFDSMRAKFAGAVNYLTNSSATENQIQLRQKFLGAVDAIDDGRDGELNLTLDWESPAEAQRIATQAMDIWIVSELEDEKAQTERRLSSIWNYKNNIVSNAKSPSNLNSNSTESSGPAIELAQRIDTLSQEIQGLEDLISAGATQRRRRRVDVQVELDRMRSRLMPSHPNLQSGEAELRMLDSTEPSDPEMIARLGEKRSELGALRLKSLGTTNMVGTSTSLAQTLGVAIAQNQATIAALTRQIEHPELRSRHHVIKAATFEATPIRRRKLGAAMNGAILTFIFAFFIAFYREYFNPLARDAWRVELSTSLPVWGQISNASMIKYPNIDLKVADFLRSQLGQHAKGSEASRALLGYRKIEMAIRRQSSGDVVLLIEGGTQGDLRGFYRNLFNIMSSDFSGSMLVIDANHVKPLTAENQGAGFITLLERYATGGDSSWLDCVSRPSGDERTFDLIHTGPVPTGHQTRLYNEKTMKLLIEQFRNRYDLIIIRGLPESHFLENTFLSAAATDTILVADAKETTRAEISRSLEQLGTKTVRGIVLVGT
jgi:flagellar biosynthesis chaperone FliJ